MDTNNFPVHTRFDIPPKSGPFDTLKRRIARLPVDRHDYAVVLEGTDGYRLVPSGSNVASVPGIDQCQAIYLVDPRAQEFSIRSQPLCSNHIERRQVTVRYQAKVVSPEQVLSDRAYPLVIQVEGWTKPIVARESAKFSSIDREEFHRSIAQTLSQELHEHPPVSLNAFNLLVVGIEVEFPTDLEEHEKELIQINREHELWQVRQALEEEKRQIQRRREVDEAMFLEGTVQRGVFALHALDAARNPDRLAGLAEAYHTERERIADLLANAAKANLVMKSAPQEFLEGISLDTHSFPPLSTSTSNGSHDRGTNGGMPKAVDKSGFDPEDDKVDSWLLPPLSDEQPTQVPGDEGS